MAAVAVEKHLGLVANIARQVGRSGRLPLEDLVQEGCLGLLYGARSFDPGKGCQFTTFAAPAVRWFILKALDKVRLLGHLSAWDEKKLVAPAGTAPEAPEEVERLLRCVRPEDRRVIEMRFGLAGNPEMSVRDIARRLGVSRQHIGFLLNRGLERMRRAGR